VSMECARAVEEQLKFKRLERSVLGCDKQFSSEGGLHGTATKRFLGGDSGCVDVVIFLREMGENQVSCVGVKPVRVGKKLTNSVVGEMAGAGKDALLHYPGIRANLQHIQIVIGFENYAVGVAKMHFNKFRHVAKVSADRHFDAIGSEGETHGVYSIMGNHKSMDVNVTHAKLLPG
jgi:hypothetical protein